MQNPERGGFPSDTQLTDERSSLEIQVSKQTTDIENSDVEPIPQSLNNATAHPVDAEFIEGGMEGWKVVFGCALISASTIGRHII